MTLTKRETSRLEGLEVAMIKETLVRQARKHLDELKEYALARIYFTTILELCELEDVDVSDIEWDINWAGCYHTNAQYGEHGEQIFTNHKFALGLGTVEELIRRKRDDVEYPWIAYISECRKDKYSPRENMRYLAFHEFAHLIEQEVYPQCPSQHEELFETVLFTLIEKYWR